MCQWLFSPPQFQTVFIKLLLSFKLVFKKYCERDHKVSLQSSWVKIDVVCKLWRVQCKGTENMKKYFLLRSEE